MNALIALLAANLAAAHPEALPTDSAEPIGPPAPALQEGVGSGEPKWKGSLNFGATNTTGNTEVTNVNLSFDAELRRARDRWTVGANWFYGEEEDRVTQRRIGGTGKYDYFVDEKLYYLANGGAENDKQSELQLRATAGVGVGYQWREDEEWKFSTEIGPNWFVEDYEHQGPDDYLAARLQYNAEYLKGENWVIAQTGAIFPSLEDSDDIYTRLDTRLRIDLNTSLFAQFQWIWDWDNTPAPGNDRSDHRYVLSIGWTF